MKELTKAERAGVSRRWFAKVKKGTGKGACWRWVGAKTLKRNGKRGVIRVGGRQGRVMSAAKVGVILAEGLKFEPNVSRRIVHRGKATTANCVNPAHNEFNARRNDRRKGERRGKSQQK